jgi:hypothetical protein
MIEFSNLYYFLGILVSLARTLFQQSLRTWYLDRSAGGLNWKRSIVRNVERSHLLTQTFVQVVERRLAKNILD